ncbi:hypothetical protein [Sphingobacterium multivorum]|uniref:hypothetical protein n=1 Tax=Sphingobacterium multivorum TaxID=28454 RepID=UPI0028ADD9A5|nr:hypothetical protein [Sphingobacterium multivorum]
MLELIYLFVIFSFIAFASSMVAFIFSEILLYEPVLNWYGRFLGKLPEWLGKPLGLCKKCLAGQLALWASMAVAIIFCPIYALWLLPYSICLSIYLTTKY